MRKPLSSMYRFAASPSFLCINTNTNFNINIGYSTAAVQVEPRKYTSIEQVICFDFQTLAYLLNKCIAAKDVSGGKSIHAHLIKAGFQSHTFLLGNLVNTYAKCGDLLSARQVFDKIPERNVVSWNVMISGYSQHGSGRKALHLFSQMQRVDMKPSHFTFASVLHSCACIPSLGEGSQVHAHVLKLGFDSDAFVSNALVDMYAKCGDVKSARQMFDEMSETNVVSWNALIAGYAQNGHFEEALKFFRDMQRENVKSNKFAISSVLQVCATIAAFKQGKQVHAQATKTGLELNMFVASSLVDMYSKCGIMEDALQVFDNMSDRDIVSWTAIIVGYAQNGYPAEALKIFREMQEAGVKPTQFPIASVLSGCGSLQALELGKQVHAYKIIVGFSSDIFVDNALVDMYAKCGNIEDAQQLFDKMSFRDVVSWNAIIAGYVQNDHGEEALKLLHKMQRTSLKPNIFTFGSALRACASLAALERGQRIHAFIIKSNVKPNVVVGCALVDMYAKCGVIEIAREVFDTWPKVDVVSWNAMIAAYAQHGCGKEAIQIYEEMQQLTIKPDEITFVSVLFACSHIGLVDKGRYFFDSMNRDHGIAPGMEHYACMVDLLGRSGHLDEAEVLIKSMPFEANAVVWKTLLGACRLHCNVDIGRRAAEFVLRLEPEDHATYILLSNIYAAANRWNDVADVRKIMRERRVKKEPGCSWVEIKNGVHTFHMGDRSHPKTEEIYAMLVTLHMQIKKAGYMPDTNCALHDGH